MAASSNNNSSCWKVPEVYQHHEQRRVCISRPKYREGRKAKAVKVYTINLESRYVMVQGVPAIGVMTELVQLCALYGAVEEYRPLDEYPAEEFTEVYLVKFQKLTSARAAKRQMDEKSFYGGILHVCYVPEYETVEDTRLKLLDRRRYIFRAAQKRAREREETQEEPTSSEPTTTPHHDSDTGSSDSARENSNASFDSGFPLLPLPPQERRLPRHRSRPAVIPTEDKMGTLHGAVVDAEPQRAQCSARAASNRDAEHTRATSLASAVRFVPRTANLERRKRRREEAGEHSAAVSGQTEPLIGPKLPEPAKLDMEDESLNTTASLIRKTMKQVESVPDLKPVEKKVKPRRRI